MEEKSKTNEKDLENLSQKEEQTKDEIDSLNNEINDLKNDQAYKDQKTNLESKSQELESLNTSIKANEDKRNKLKTELTKLESDLDKLTKDLGGEKLNQLKNEKTSQEEQLTGLKNDLENNKASQSAKAKEIKDLKTSIETLKEEIEKIDSEIDANNRKIAELKITNQTSDNNIKAKEIELAFLKENANRKPTDKEIAEAQAQWDKGSIGFFEKMGSEDALRTFDTLPSGKENHKNAKKYLELNIFDGKLDSSDSRTLENMYKAIKNIGKINEKRINDGGIDGRELSVLKITDKYMAIAQANANFSYKSNNSHASINGQFENLAWGDGTIKQAIYVWWDEEKAVFDYLREQDLSDEAAMSNYISNNYNDLAKKFRNPQIGHYLNFVDDAWFNEKGSPYKYNNAIMGYAVRVGDYGYVQSMVTTETDFQNSYSVEEYQTRFLAYYNNLKDIIEGRKNPLTDKYKEDIASLEAELNILKAEQEAKEQEISDLETKTENLVKEVTEKDSQLNTKEASLKNLNNEVSRLSDEENKLNNQITSTEDKINDLDKEIKAYLENHEDAQAKIKEAEDKVDKAKADLTSIEDTLTNQNQEKSSLEGEIASLNQSIKTQEDKIKELSDQKETKKSELTKLEEEKSAKTEAQERLNQEISDLDKNIETNKAEAENLEAKNEEAKQNLNEKSQAYKDAKTSNAKLKEENKTYSDLKSKAEEAQKALEKAQENLKKAQANTQDAKDKLDAAKAKLAKAKASNDAVKDLKVDDLDSLLDKGISVGAISAFRAAEKKIKELEEPIKEAKEKLALSKKSLAESQKAYNDSLRRFNQAAADLAIFTKAKEDKKPNLPNYGIDDDYLPAYDEEDETDSDTNISVQTSLDLFKLRQALLRNRTVIKAAELLLEIAPEKVKDVKPQLLKLIKEAKELCRLAENMLVANGYHSN